MEKLSQIGQFILFHKNFLNQIIVFVSFLGVLAGVGILFFDLINRLKRKEIVLLGAGVVVSFLVRLQFGLFGPIHPEDHHVELILNIVRNLREGSFFSVPYTYGNVSGGLFELIHNNILTLLPNFHVYQIYYINLGLHLICGLLVFLLALNLFKKKSVAFISFLIFAFLPVLIKFSATEIKFIVDALTILLFINFIYYIFKYGKEKSPLHFGILALLFTSNLVGRLDYMPFFIGSFFLLSFIFLVSNRKSFQRLKSNIYVKLFFSFTVLVSAFYLLTYVFFGDGMGVISEHYLSRDLTHDYRFIKNFFRFTNPFTTTFATFTNSFFSPWYFFIALVVSPLVLLIKKRAVLLCGFLIAFLFAVFLRDLELSNNIRKLLPLLILSIPLTAYTLHLILKKIKIPEKIGVAVLAVVVIVSPIQNWEFLTTNTDRKLEQDFLIRQFEKNIPSESLILTVHEKKYEDSQFSKTPNHYRHRMHGNEFYTYLLPPDKEIDVMDIYHEYDSEKIKEYENVFYYRSLYSYHEEGLDAFSKSIQNPEHKSAPEVTEKFEEFHSLIPVKEKVVENYGFHIRSADQLLQRKHFTIDTDRKEPVIGLYQIKDFID